MQSCEVKGDHVITNPTPTLERFAGQRYVRLTSYRKSGTAVSTPVHLAVEGDHAFVRTWSTTGKFKRIVHNPAIEIAPSTWHGRPTGPAIQARARVLSGAEAVHAAQSLAQKYPLLQGILVPLYHRLRGYRTVHVELMPTDR
jgi:PPOX class probable F420-dependent enzyme